MCAEKITFFRSYYETLPLIEDEIMQLRFIKGLLGFAFDDVEPDFTEDPMLQAIWINVKPNIENSKKFRASGAKGGRPRSDSKTKGSEDMETIGFENCETPVEKGGFENCETPVEKGGLPRNRNRNRNRNSKEDKDGDSKGKASAFSPPSIEEVTLQCQEKGYTVDPESFIAYYESNGWRVGRNKMKDWKAALVTWNSREKRERKQKGIVDAADYAMYD